LPAAHDEVVKIELSNTGDAPFLASRWRHEDARCNDDHEVRRQVLPELPREA
jgi:hypothetical protein